MFYTDRRLCPNEWYTFVVLVLFVTLGEIVSIRALAGTDEDRGIAVRLTLVHST
jgi:hypothetical protein